MQIDSDEAKEVALERIQPPNLLMLQETSHDQVVDNARMIAWGGQALSGLRMLQRAILGDGDRGAVLAQLDQFCNENLVTADPELSETIRAIQLRVAVEVAKMRRHPMRPIPR